MLRRAPFIWMSSQAIDDHVDFRTLLREGPSRRDDGVNRWVLFRRTIELPSAPSSASLSITVDGRYQLYVNGVFVGRGSVRASPAFQRFDCHEVAKQLCSGSNVVAVLVHVYGVDTAWYERARDYWQSVFGDGGLYCEACIECDRVTVQLVSDCEWKWHECTAWHRDTPRSGWGQDFIEDHDARLMPQGWTQRDFDDSGWSSCQIQIAGDSASDRVRGWGPIEPFPTLLPREVPQLAETILAPARVFGMYAVRPREELPINRRLYEEALEELPGGLIDAPDALLEDDDSVTTVRTAPDLDVALLIAFDRRHAGYPYIEVEAGGGEVVELAVAETVPGEYDSRAVRPTRLTRATFLDCAHLFRYTARPGRQRFQKFEWTAVKYAQLVVRNAPQGIRIRHVGSVYTHYPVENRGTFECSDALLNHLWKVGRYTTLQCTHDAWEDCPGREKRQWLGDGVVHYLVNAAAFGPSTQPLDRQFLLHGAESQRPDGLLQMFAPGDHHTHGVIIPDFNLHWIAAAHHYLLHTDDARTIEQIFPAIERSLAWFGRHVGPNGLLVDVPHWHFIEWADTERDGEAATINAMLVGALNAAMRLAQHIGYEGAARRFEDRAAGIAQALNERHWDDTRGVYVDSVDPLTNAQHARVSQHANAAMIEWGIAPRVRWSRMIAYVTDKRRLRLTAVPPVVPMGEEVDPQTDVVRTNTYFSHFLYSALAKAGRFDLALEGIRAFYGPMLETGTETLWESCEPAASLCHAFSASPVYQLSAHVLGVTPIVPGFRRFRLHPQPADLQFATGTYPTPLGDIHVEWRRETRAIELHIAIPERTEAEVLPPAAFELETSSGRLGAGVHHLRFVPLRPRHSSPARD